jgi:hypothetical protein
MFHAMAGAITGGIIAFAVAVAIGWSPWPALIVCAIHIVILAVIFRESR